MKRDPRGKQLSALAHVDRPKWISKIRGAIVAEQGNVTAASRSLGIGVRQLWRWIEKNPEILDGTEHVSKRPFGESASAR